MTGTIIPLYVGYSSSHFDTLISLAKKYPNVPVTCIVSSYVPDSDGNGQYFQQGLQDRIIELQKYGIKVIMYLYTMLHTEPPFNETARGVDVIDANIDSIYGFYPSIDGIFFDEYTTNSFGVSGYTSVCNYARSKGATVIVGNPGSAVSIGWYSAYPDAPDAMCIFEHYNPIPSASTIADYAGTRDRKSIIPYKKNSADISDATYLTYPTVCGWIYIQDDDLPNPWDTLTSWMERQMQLLSMVNEPAINITDTNGKRMRLDVTDTITDSNSLRMKDSIRNLGMNLRDVSEDRYLRIKTSAGVKSIKQL